MAPFWCDLGCRSRTVVIIKGTVNSRLTRSTLFGDLRSVPESAVSARLVMKKSESPLNFAVALMVKIFPPLMVCKAQSLMLSADGRLVLEQWLVNYWKGNAMHMNSLQEWWHHATVRRESYILPTKGGLTPFKQVLDRLWSSGERHNSSARYKWQYYVHAGVWRFNRQAGLPVWSWPNWYTRDRLRCHLSYSSVLPSNVDSLLSGRNWRLSNIYSSGSTSLWV